MHLARHEFLKEEKKNAASETLGDFFQSLLFTWEGRTQEQMVTAVDGYKQFQFLDYGKAKINHYL